MNTKGKAPMDLIPVETTGSPIRSLSPYSPSSPIIIYPEYSSQTPPQTQTPVFLQSPIPKKTSSTGKSQCEDITFLVDSIIEDIHAMEDPNRIAKIYLYNNISPSNDIKTREWYEAILLETGSITIVHYYHKNTKMVSYSKLQIRKILSFSEWNLDPAKANKLQAPEFPNKYYRHFEYVDAWHKVLAIQNNYNSHTWFLQFKMAIVEPFSNWFRNWFSVWGSGSQILPEPLQVSQARFIEFNGKDSNVDYHLYFMALYQLPWILKWNFAISKNISNNYEYIPCIGKKISVKWWDIFVYKNLESDQIKLRKIPEALGSYSYEYPNNLSEYIRQMKKKNPKATKEELEKQLL
ncbi:uncharacterized protein LOC110008302 [Amborella trichopoda]|uniref:uncharacterized protein LOC110008302 n=1 Tax=Amborella trichopoda TaxID=13333 RepID=UPI0009C025DA|nr:uncharacterized protein LOC110008302 [Amborella trichopoda]XP_020530615.1 uncharacterized protein LOC110008302 [Amborella trichopoda]XP_020530616.1 uncharacterized protein LOC110008302 [Amborella trichopoda]|eukprot:XP_020530614.1 uncharacterized protein LOC110008302 [Amborella trichopoda]